MIETNLRPLFYYKVIYMQCIKNFLVTYFYESKDSKPM